MVEKIVLFKEVRQLSMRLGYVLIFATLLFCNNDKQIDKDLAMIYVEMRIAEQELGASDAGKAAMQSILEKRNLSLADFEARINKIKANPDKWIQFQQSVISCLDSFELSKKKKD